MKKRFRLPFASIRPPKLQTGSRTTFTQLIDIETPSDPVEAVVFIEEWMSDAEAFLQRAAANPNANPREIAHITEARQRLRGILWDLNEANAEAERIDQARMHASEDCRAMVASWSQKNVVSMYLSVLMDEKIVDKHKALHPIIELLKEFNPELLDSSFDELHEITEAILKIKTSEERAEIEEKMKEFEKNYSEEEELP